MKRYISFILLIFFSTALISQDLTGIWRGSFYNIREMMMGGTKYRYEVQIDNNGKKINGVTYSYQTTRFYGKASLVGIWTPSTQNLVMKEEKMEDLKIEGGGEGCLMTCYMDYHKEGDREWFEGSYSSRNMNTGADCGGGKVYLERVPDSDFEKEDFLQKKSKKSAVKIKPGQEDYLVNGSDTDKIKPNKPVAPPIAKNTTPPSKAIPPKSQAEVKKTNPTKPVAKSTPAVKPKSNTSKPPVASVKKATPLPAEVKKSPNTIVSESQSDLKKIEPEIEIKPAPAPAPIKIIPPPLVLKQRKNELFQTIKTSAREILISFYDNGVIDGDTISVYDNNRLIVNARGLSAKPITVKIIMDEDEPEHEIVMVAENLGSIPPNTALMIVEAGKQRYTVNLSSNEQNNAMVRFRYQKAE